MKRNQRKYTPMLKRQIVELTDRTIEHLERSKTENDPLVSLQEAVYAYSTWDAIHLIVVTEDLPLIVDVNIEDLNKQIKMQLQKSLDRVKSMN